MSPQRIRDEEPEDVPAIQAVVTAAFGQTLEADLVDRLRADGDNIPSLVAIDENEVVGHVMFSRMAAPFPAVGLAPVSVALSRQGQGIGSALIREGLQRLAAGPWQAVFVLGDPAYYRRFGFDAALASGFTSPYTGQHLMALFLRGDPPVRTGRVDYASAFAALA